MPAESKYPHVILDDDRRWLYVTNFLPQQGNWPLTDRGNVAIGIARCFHARKEFGLRVLMILAEKTQVAPPKELLRGCEAPDEGLISPSGKGKGKGKRGSAEGEHYCLKRATLDCREPGIYLHTEENKVYWLCEKHEQESKEHAASQTV